MSKRVYVLGAIGCIILAIGGVLGADVGSNSLSQISLGSHSEGSTGIESSTGDDSSIIAGGIEEATITGMEMDSLASEGGDSHGMHKEEASAYSGSSQVDLSGEDSNEKLGGYVPSSAVTPDASTKISDDVSKHEVPKVSRMELVITKSAEIAIEGLFPPVESANPLTVEDISKYPSIELGDEKVLDIQIDKRINFYKVESPITHDAISALSTSDPRVEIGVSSGFDLFVNENQPRMERILRFLDSMSLGVAGQERIDLAVLLFSVVAYGECIKKLRGFNSSLDVAEVCSQLSREDVLTIQPEDLPKNVLKEKVELFKLSGLVLSIPFPIFTNPSSLKWRHMPNPNGIYQVYNSGAIDGFAHFDFLYKKIHDITTFLYSPVFQTMDDVRVDLHYGLRAIRHHLGHMEQAKKVKKDIARLTDFFVSWFKGGGGGSSKSKKKCSKDYFDTLLALEPVYAAVHEISRILRLISQEVSSNPKSLEEFNGISKHVLTHVNLNERKLFTSNIVPILVMTYNGVNQGKVKSIRFEILRIIAILEEIEFNSTEVVRTQQGLQKCMKGSSAFKYELGAVKRNFYALVKVVRKSNPQFPFPLPSSPLYIKGAKFGLKNIFRKNVARSKLGYYREVNPFDPVKKSSKK